MSVPERPPTTTRPSPYQGLVPYGEADAQWFFGREEMREIVLDNLRAYRVSVLYGESGVGKSSLLQAAVLAGLRGESQKNMVAVGSAELLAVGFSDWSMADPARALKDAIARAAADLSREIAVPAPEGSLADVLTAWCERVDGTVFLVLDQLEEFFLYHGSSPAGRAFEAELVDAMRARGIAANFLLALREDGLAKLDRLQDQIPGLLDNLIRLEHLEADAARRAIEDPLKHWNGLQPGRPVTIEESLVEQVLDEVEAGKVLVAGAGGSGRVRATDQETRIESPYLQLVLVRIWDEERAVDSSVLRLATLQRLGGAEQIVRTHLDKILAGFSRKDRRVAANSFRYLVTPSGTKIAHRPGDLAEYTDVALERLKPILRSLAGEPRILRSVAGEAYEIYHDVLAAAVLDWRRRYEERRTRRLLRGVVLAVAVGLVAIVVVAYLGQLFSALEDRTLRARASVRDAPPPAAVVIVAIDDRTFAVLTKRWPDWPRTWHGRVIDQLRRDGADVIAYDVQFTQPSRRSEEDAALYEAAGRARNLVFAATEVDQHGQTAVLGGERNLRRIRARAGWSVLPVSRDGVVRSIEWGDPDQPDPARRLQSFGLAAAETATRRRIAPSRLGGDTAPIDYAGPTGTIRSVSFSDVYHRRFAKGTFRGKVVVVGAVSPSLQDVYSTPAGGGLMSGAEIQANVVATALAGFPLRIRTALDIALIALLGLLVPLATYRLRWWSSLGIAIAAAALYVGVVAFAFNRGLVLAAVYPLLALALTSAFALGWTFRHRKRQDPMPDRQA